MLDDKLVSKFWSFIEMGDDCWRWTGATDKHGYGRMRVPGGKNKTALPHRLSWEIHSGTPVSSGLWVLHKCDNPNCCNPAHLYVGTPADNTRDMMSRGRCRSPGGEKGQLCATAKMSADMVAQIRTLAANGTRHSAIAAAYGIAKSHVSNLYRKVTWKHL